MSGQRSHRVTATNRTDDHRGIHFTVDVCASQQRQNTIASYAILTTKWQWFFSYHIPTTIGFLIEAAHFVTFKAQYHRLF